MHMTQIEMDRRLTSSSKHRCIELIAEPDFADLLIFINSVDGVLIIHMLARALTADEVLRHVTRCGPN